MRRAPSPSSPTGLLALLIAVLGAMFGGAGCGDNIELGAGKELTAFAFRQADNPGLAADVTATISGFSITADLPPGSDVSALVATFITTGEAVTVRSDPQVSGTTANNFTNPVVYTVTAGDGTQQGYTVIVTVGSSASKDLTAFAFLDAANPALAADVTATITGTAIAATVPFGTDVTALVATFTTTGETVAVGATGQTSGVTANDFTSPVTYTVTAQDASTRDYTVTVTIAAATAKELTAFAFLDAANPALAADVTATITGTAITATVPFATDVTALVATFATTGASVTVGGTAQVSGTTANDFTTTVTYTVTAADGSTQAYAVTVTIAASPAKDLTAFAFLDAANPALAADVTATITGTAITATVPFATDVTALVATFTSTGASVAVGGTAQVSGTTANDFTSPVTYTVTAADGSTEAYTVTVTLAPSPAKALTAFGFLDATNPALAADVTATITGTAIAATVPFATDVTALVATFTTTGASVTVGGTAQVSGTTANDFTSPVTYTVTAADSSTEAYTVTITIAPPPTCDPLTAPTGGTVAVTNGGVFPSTATYACATGRLINPTGGETATCTPDGSWSPADAPTCDLAIMVVRVGDGATTLDGASTPVAIEERRLTDGVVGRTLALPIALAGLDHPLTLSGTSASEGHLALSEDLRFVTLGGYATAPGTAAVTSTLTGAVQRVIGVIDAAGQVDTTTRLDAFSGGNLRSVTTSDGTAFWAVGSVSAIQYATLGSTGPSTTIAAAPTNNRVAHLAGGQLYAGGGTAVSSVGTGTPTTTGQTATAILTSTSVSAFALVDVSPVVLGPDTLYLAREAGAVTGELNIHKWTFDGTTWTQDTTFAPPLAGAGNNTRHLAAFVDDDAVHVIATTSATSNNRLVTFVDDGSTSTPAVTQLTEAGASFVFRGVARSPSVP